MSETNLGTSAEGTLLGQIVELNPAFPPTIDIDGALFVKNGFAVLAGYDPMLEPYKTVITGFSSVEMPVPIADLNGMAGADGVLIGVGGLATAGFIIRSTNNGASWTVILRNLAPSLTDVKEFDGVYVACATGGKMYRSTDDGLTWTVISLEAGVNFKSLATSGSSWIAVSNNSTAKPIWRSKDGGLTWATVVAPSAISRSQVVYSGGVYMSVGGTNHYWRSFDDGASWLQQQLTASDIALHVAVDERLVIITGGTNNSNYIGYNGLGAEFTIMGGFNNTLGASVVIGDYVYFFHNATTIFQKTKILGMNSSGSNNYLPVLTQTFASQLRKLFQVSGMLFIARDVNFLERSINGVGIDISAHSSDMFSTSTSFKNSDAGRYYMRYA